MTRQMLRPPIPPLALPLGELSPQVTERVKHMHHHNNCACRLLSNCALLHFPSSETEEKRMHLLQDFLIRYIRHRHLFVNQVLEKTSHFSNFCARGLPQTASPPAPSRREPFGYVHWRSFLLNQETVPGFMQQCDRQIGRIMIYLWCKISRIHQQSLQGGSQILERMMVKWKSKEPFS